MKYLDEYMSFACGNEAPRIFHLWTAISTISAAIGKRVRFDLGYFPIMSNMYVVLVGSPGCGKNTAMNLGKYLLRDLGDIYICADAITREKLVRVMAEEDSVCRKTVKLDNKVLEFTQLSVFSAELIHFLGMNAVAMVDFLTNIWDEDVKYDNLTKNKGEDFIPEPYITLLGCMTPEITTSYLKQSIITGGFTRRAIFVLAHRRGDPIAIPVITPEQKQSRKICLTWLASLRDVSGHLQWDVGCPAKWTTWYNAYRLDTTRITDPATMGYFESKSTQVLKLAIILSLCESHDLLLRWKYIELAIELLRDVEANLSQVFLGVGRNDSAQLAAKAVSYLETVNEACTKKRLYGVLFNDAPHGRQDIDQVLHHLVDTGKIHIGEFGIENTRTLMYGTREALDRFNQKLIQAQKNGEIT